MTYRPADCPEWITALGGLGESVAYEEQQHHHHFFNHNSGRPGLSYTSAGGAAKGGYTNHLGSTRKGPGSSYGGAADRNTVLHGKLPTPPADPRKPRRVIRINRLGIPSLVEIDRNRLVSELGLAYRDLRVIDPSLPTPSPASIFIREKALVVNLESIRMVVGKDVVYVLSARHQGCSSMGCDMDCVLGQSPLQCPFVQELCRRLALDGSDYSGRSSAVPAWRPAVDLDLPYELRALEAALGEALRVLDMRVVELEEFTWPALERLAAMGVSQGNLEHVREAKRQMNRLSEAVRRLKEELEDILDDDADMLDMYLGRRADAAAAEAAEYEEEMRASNAGTGYDTGNDARIRSSWRGGKFGTSGGGGRVPPAAGWSGRAHKQSYDGDQQGSTLHSGSEFSDGGFGGDKGGAGVHHPAMGVVSNLGGGGQSRATSSVRGVSPAWSLPPSPAKEQHALLQQVVDTTAASKANRSAPSPSGSEHQPGSGVGHLPGQLLSPREGCEQTGNLDLIDLDDALSATEAAQQPLLHGGRPATATNLAGSCDSGEKHAQFADLSCHKGMEASPSNKQRSLSPCALGQTDDSQRPAQGRQVAFSGDDAPSQSAHDAPRSPFADTDGGGNSSAFGGGGAGGVNAANLRRRRSMSSPNLNLLQGQPDAGDVAPRALAPSAGLRGSLAGNAFGSCAALSTMGGNTFVGERRRRGLPGKGSRWPRGSRPGLRGGWPSGSSSGGQPVDPHDIEDVENLLETCFLQVDAAESRLGQLKERIDDTEDLVVLDLDSRRNQIVGLDLVVTSVTLCFTFVTSVAGVFGMNLANGWEQSHAAFAAVTALSFVIGFVIFLTFMLYVRKRGLFFIPDAASVLRTAI